MRLCLWLLVALPLLSQDRPAGKGVNSYSLEKEAALGAQLAADVTRATEPLDSQAVRDYVNQLGQRLARRFPESALTYTFAVIATDPASATHEPLGLPGGYIFVPAGLFLAVQNEAEFAGMMAHAMAHVAAHHYTRQATRGEITNTAGAPLICMGGWSRSAMGQGQSIAIPLGLLSFQRLCELEADRLAVSAMAEAGFDPAALANYIILVQPPEDDAQPAAVSSLPARDQRVAALREAIQKVPARAYPASGTSQNGVFPGIQDEVRRAMPAPPPAPTLRH
jgi:predicted Zn-dependent protease